MGVYDLQNPAYLEYDITSMIDRINQYFKIDFENGQIQISTKLVDTSDTFWASEENSEEFNQHIPTFKSLHTDMYAIVENISKQKFGKFEYTEFEDKYEDFKEFRLLNNLIKHLKKKEVEITITKVVYVYEKQFDLTINFHYSDSPKYLFYSSFVTLFLTILMDFEIINVSSYSS